MSNLITFDSSVGRAVDCRGIKNVDIHRSLVQIRLEGLLFVDDRKVVTIKCQLSTSARFDVSPSAIDVSAHNLLFKVFYFESKFLSN
jgi:hypothetical protein